MFMESGWSSETWGSGGGREESGKCCRLQGDFLLDKTDFEVGEGQPHPRSLMHSVRAVWLGKQGSPWSQSENGK